jgi:STAM-binding protein
MVSGKPLYFRGRRVIDAVLAYLMKNHNLGSAENVLLTGCSAGGLATYLHTDYVGDTLKATVPSLKKYKASSISGFFLLHDNVEGKPVYPTQMKNIFELANSTHGVNSACIAAKAPADQWECNFAEEAYAYTHSPTFPLNSALDSWQTGCIYTSELPPNFPNQTGTENGVCSAAAGYAGCSHNPENCTQPQIKVMNQYIADFQTKMATDAPGTTHAKPGNGAFVHSCHTHCEAQSGSWNSFQIGGVSMQQAMGRWWNSDGTDPAAQHTYTPCSYKDGPAGPRKCNPTC